MGQQEQQVPTLRFPEFRDEWKKYNLGELLEISSASRVHKNQWKNSGVPFFRTSDVMANFNVSENKKAFISEELFKELTEKSGPVKKDDLLVTGGGSIGIPYLIKSNEPIYFKDADLLWLKNTGRINACFLYSFFLTPVFRKYLKSITHTGTISHYTIEQAKTTPITIPSETEQQKISSFLNAVDEKIAELQKKKDLLQDYKKGCMQKLFSQVLRFKDDKGKDFPDWEEGRLGHLCDVRDGTHDSPKYQNTGHPLITSKNLLPSGKLDMENVSYISSKDYEDINKRSKVDVGDILFGMIGTIGNPVRVDRDCFAIKNVALIKKKTKLLLSYLIHYLSSSYIAKQFYMQNAGGTQKFLSLGIIREIRIKFPNPDEQKKIADFLASLDDKITLVSEELDKAKAFKKGLLQQMFV